MVEGASAGKQIPSLKKPPGFRDPGAPQVRPKPPQVRKTLPPSFPRERRRRRFCRCCCCFFTVLILTLVVLLAAAGGVFYLWYKPHLPVFHLQSVRSPKFKISTTPDGTVLDSQMVIRVQATNPNGKIGLSYRKGQVRISSGNGDEEVDLGSGKFPDFEQKKKNSTVLKFAGQVKKQVIDDGVGKNLKDQFRSKQMVVNVEIRTSVEMRLEKWKVAAGGLRVVCAGSLRKLEAGATPTCQIKVLNWINLN